MRTQGFLDQSARAEFLAGFEDPQLRPALDERDLAHHAAEAVVAHLAGDAGRLEHVAQVRNLDDRLRGMNLARIGRVAVSIAR